MMLKMHEHELIEYLHQHAGELASELLTWKDTTAMGSRLQELITLCTECSDSYEKGFALAEVLITYEALERLARQTGHEQS